MASFDFGKYKTDLETLKGLPIEQQNFALSRMYPEASPDADFYKDLLGRVEKSNTPEAIRERLAAASEFDEKRINLAGKYKMLFDLPNTLINAYAVPSQIQAQGAANIAQMMTQGAQNIPQLTNYQRGSFNFTPGRYF